MHHSIVTYQTFLVFQIFLAITIFNNNIGSVWANAVTPEIPTVSDNENELNDMMMSNDDLMEEKRNWQSLQGSWGKRAPSDNDFNAEEKRNWQSLQGSWGKRSANDNDLGGNIMDNEAMIPVLITTNMETKPKTQLAFITNPAALEQLANQHHTMENNALDNDENIFNEKRGWKKLNGAWGKRRNGGQSWNRELVSSASSLGSWGKREPNWNNLKGMWGKRSGNGWLKLNNGWGKRSQHYPETN